MTNRKRKRHNRNLQDSAMSSFLNILKYKSERLSIPCIEIGQYDATTRVCSNCGYNIGKLETNIREWECPKCKSKHDRDINAAIMILKRAKLKQAKEMSC